ncbi:MAG: hypothetical protein K8R74_02160 [Bacteroidales bacterium]|nr:hypothetical protein [Bacteroidales bacterium]
MIILSVYMDDVFEFEGQWGVPSHCGLKVVKKAQQVVVVTTELYETNPGTSVTRWTAQLANTICDLKKIDPGKLIFIVHIPDRKSKLEFYKETFDMVRFDIENGRLINPVWNRIPKEEVDNLLI